MFQGLSTLMDEYYKKLGDNNIASENRDTRKFLFVLIENFSLVAFSNAIEPLRLANRTAKRRLYSYNFFRAVFCMCTA